MTVLNLAHETSSTSGTGPYDFDGAVSPYFTFVARADDEIGGGGPYTSIEYIAISTAGYEIGEGTLTDGAPDTLTRGTIHHSSNSDNAVSWPGGGEVDIYSFPRAALLVPRAYTEHTTSANLTANTRNVFKSGTLTMTLPLLSIMTDGDIIEGSISGSDHTVKVNEHASDSNAELWTGYAEGDNFFLIVVDGAWHVAGEKSTVYGRLTKTSDLSVSRLTYVDGYGANYAEQLDKGDWWHTSNDELTAAFPCVLEIHSIVIANIGANNLHMVPRINGTEYLDVSEIGRTSNPNGSHSISYKIDLSTGDTVEFYIWNAHPSTSFTMKGNGSDDESRVSWSVDGRTR